MTKKGDRSHNRIYIRFGASLCAFVNDLAFSPTNPSVVLSNFIVTFAPWPP